MRKTKGDRRNLMKSKKALTMISLSVLLLLLASTASAQDVWNEDLAFQMKSEAAAQRYSFLGTTLPIAAGVVSAYNGRMGTPEITLITAGIIAGASLGYFYGGDASRGVQGIAIRGGLAAASLIIGNKMGLEIDIFGTGEADDEGWPIVIIGTVLVIGHAISDVAGVRDHIWERNDELIRRSQASVTLNPRYFVDSGAGGLELQVTF
jgi:hypothetical protein